AGRVLLPLGEAEVDAGAEVGVHRGVRVDGLVAQPAAPRVALAHRVEVAHGRTVAPPPSAQLTRPRRARGAVREPARGDDRGERRAEPPSTLDAAPRPADAGTGRHDRGETLMSLFTAVGPRRERRRWTAAALTLLLTVCGLLGASAAEPADPPEVLLSASSDRSSPRPLD